MINNSEILQVLKEKRDALLALRNTNSIENIIVMDENGNAKINNNGNIFEIIQTYTDHVADLCYGDYELVAMFSKYFRAIDRELYDECIVIQSDIEEYKKQKGLL
jgi:hypothetical protein